MMKIKTQEYRKGNKAVIEKEVVLFGLPLFYTIETTTNVNIVSQLSKPKKSNVKPIKGFNNV